MGIRDQKSYITHTKHTTPTVYKYIKTFVNSIGFSSYCIYNIGWSLQGYYVLPRCEFMLTYYNLYGQLKYSKD